MDCTVRGEERRELTAGANDNHSLRHGEVDNEKRVWVMKGRGCCWWRKRRWWWWREREWMRWRQQTSRLGRAETAIRQVPRLDGGARC